MSNMISGLPTVPVAQPASKPLTAPATGSGEGAGFGDLLRSAIDQVEQLHTEAQQQAAGMIGGNNQDLHNVMIAVEKADIAFQLMMQVRNKIVNAYEEISRMQF